MAASPAPAPLCGYRLDSSPPNVHFLHTDAAGTQYPPTRTPYDYCPRPATVAFTLESSGRSHSPSDSFRQAFACHEHAPVILSNAKSIPNNIAPFIVSATVHTALSHDPHAINVPASSVWTLVLRHSATQRDLAFMDKVFTNTPPAIRAANPDRYRDLQKRRVANQLLLHQIASLPLPSHSPSPTQ